MRYQSAIEVVVLVPGLLGPADTGSDDPRAAQALVAGLELDALDRLLARADQTAEAAADGSIESLAFRSFGHAFPPDGADPPVAAFTALLDCDSGEAATWLRADPVHLRADIADLVLFDATDAALSADEACALVRIVNDALRPDGPFVEAAHPHRWYVRLGEPAHMVTTPLSLAAGAPVSSMMPRGPDAARWHGWMNEVQMALHECPVNIDREQRRAVPINSVWPWGAGSLVPAPEPVEPFVGVWSDDALVCGLARHAGIAHGARPAGADEWLERVQPPGVHLIDYGDLHRAARRTDLDAWRAGLERFNELWAKPMLAALDRGTVARVSMRDEGGRRFTATRRGRLRWWRREGLAARIGKVRR